MARRKRIEGDERPFEPTREKPMLELTSGFYIVNENQQVVTKEVTRGKPGSEDRRTVTEPIRFRTIQSAKDACSLSNGRCGILFVRESLDWPL